jgi:pyruvate formate lyase activating enzyme
MPGIIFDIQNYSIYDGPGIRTAVYFKGCPLSCYWCHNPESQKPEPEMGYWQERCKVCGTCIEACPENALRLEDDRTVRDYKLCKNCGACAKACPNDAMEKIGYKTMPQSILEKVVRDRPFFDESGGGVTITGGEPAMQKDFLIGLLSVLKGSGINTAIETCGYFSEDLIEALVEKADLFLFDIKHMDSEEHKKATGADNKKILDNFSGILKKAGEERIIPRIPLIPGFNTYMQAFADIIKFVGEQGYRGPVHLMPHHGWAKGKYQRIGRGGGFKDPGRVSGGEIERIRRVVVQAGMEPVLYG